MADSQLIPIHLGIILDGNRRWAKNNGLPAIEGHRQGYDTFKKIVKAAFKSGVLYLSAFVFSTENWSRTPSEVKYLMEMAYKMVTKELDELKQEGIRVVWMGSLDKVSPKLVKAMQRAEAETKHNHRATLGLCFNYGGQQEIVNAAQQLVQRGIAAEKINQETFAQELYQPDIPELDLVIRTSGERRTSGFMLFRAAYAELIFVDTLWPDFTEQKLADCFDEYAQRKRRFGT